MEQGNLSRRGFLSRSMAGLTVGAGLPLWYAREVLDTQQAHAAETGTVRGPNDKIVMGAIGIGSPKSRGSAIMNDAIREKNVEFVAVCDVDAAHRDKAAGAVDKVFGKKCDKYADFRELLARKDIDAVTIATPDHWHAIIAIAALKAGKDVYCEKPMTLTVEEAIAVEKVAKATGRVFQVGSQQRSDARFRMACELVRNGRLGKVQRVETRIGANPKGGPFKVQAPPAGLDWDMWQGPTPSVDYVTERCHYEFRWWYEYSGGKITDWGAHHNDIAQWGLGMDESGPVAIEASGVAPSKDPHSYNTHPDFEIKYTYASGAVVACMSKGENGIKFEGEDGKWIFVSRGKIDASDKALLSEALPSSATKLYNSPRHMGNFLTCVRERKSPICNAEVGASSVIVCHVGGIALRSGKKLAWDPAKRQFADAEMNSWLSRPMRAPWKLEV